MNRRKLGRTARLWQYLFGSGSRREQTRHSTPQKESVTSQQAVPAAASKPPLLLLEEARAYRNANDWTRAKTAATGAIQTSPALTEAYMIRAFARRLENDLDGAMADYAKVIEIDPQNAHAWMFRGACAAQKSSTLGATSPASGLLEEAHRCYKKTAELQPDEEQAGLALLELEICMGKHREAVGTTGTWWGRVQTPSNKVISAWLGALAFILAGRPEAKWAHFREFLEKDTANLEPAVWSVVEIDHVLDKLRTAQPADEPRTAAALSIHRLFLSHFGKGGPAIVGHT